MQTENKIFDNLTAHTLRWPCKQPDLRTVIRLFLNAVPAWFRRLSDLQKHLRIYSVSDKTAILGADYKNLEFRLCLIRCEKFSADLIIILAGSYLNPSGFFQSLLTRPLLLVALSSTLKTMARQRPFLGHPQNEPAGTSGGSGCRLD